MKGEGGGGGEGGPGRARGGGGGVGGRGGDAGVYTADWAGAREGGDCPVAMSKGGRMLEEKSAPLPRKAAFNATRVLAWPDGHDEVFEGRVEGEVVWPTRGDKGFGFDPMFLPAGETETFGEMDPNRKHEMSHRAEAFRKLVTGCFA